MVTKMAPTYASLTLGFLEETALYPKIETKFERNILIYFKEDFWMMVSLFRKQTTQNKKNFLTCLTTWTTN